MCYLSFFYKGLPMKEAFSIIFWLKVKSPKGKIEAQQFIEGTILPNDILYKNLPNIICA